MGKCYMELRKSSARGSDSIAADMMRHLHSRQHLGKTLIVADEPLSMLAAGRKQWLKLARSLQKQRAQTLNADKILKYTHTIARMQHLRFTTKGPLEEPTADIYFLTPANLSVMPLQCWTVYLFAEPSLEAAAGMIKQLPAETLFVDYRHTLPWEKQFGLQPKQVLEAQVDSEWHQVKQFLSTHHIDIAGLTDNEICDPDAMDDALDNLLAASHKFLQVANEFQRALELARPLQIDKNIRASQDFFDAVGPPCTSTISRCVYPTFPGNL